MIFDSFYIWTGQDKRRSERAEQMKVRAEKEKERQNKMAVSVANLHLRHCPDTPRWLSGYCAQRLVNHCAQRAVSHFAQRAVIQ